MPLRFHYFPEHRWSPIEQPITWALYPLFLDCTSCLSIQCFSLPFYMHLGKQRRNLGVFRTFFLMFNDDYFSFYFTTISNLKSSDSKHLLGTLGVKSTVSCNATRVSLDDFTPITARESPTLPMIKSRPFIPHP